MASRGGTRFEQIPRMLAILTINGDYSYIDRLSYSHSKELALFYIREATRALHALKRSPPEEIEKDKDAKTLLDNIDADSLENEIIQITDRGDDTKSLREMLSLICARALAKSSRFVRG